MKWKYYPLQADDKRTTEQFALCFRYDSALVQKLQARFSLGDGDVFAIALEGLDLDALEDFHYATYRSGKQWNEAAGTTSIPIGDRSIDGLISYLNEFLRLTDRGTVVIANWMNKRTDPDMSPEARMRPDVQATHLCTSRIAFFGDEVYHVLTPDDTDPELIEDTIREPWHQSFTGVCVAGLTVPENNEFSTDFLDELAVRTQHIFVPAFDGEGFLVWNVRNHFLHTNN